MAASYSRRARSISPDDAPLWHYLPKMKSSLVTATAAVLLAHLACTAFGQSDPYKEGKRRFKEGAYYEFRGHVIDRNPLEHVFILGWEKGSQFIGVTTETKIFRHGRGAKLGEVKPGDAARGLGKVRNGKLTAIAVAFGDEGVELPSGIKIPDVIINAPDQASQ